MRAIKHRKYVGVTKQDMELPRKEAALAAVAAKHTVTQGRTHQCPKRRTTNAAALGRELTAVQKTEAAWEKKNKQPKSKESRKICGWG